MDLLTLRTEARSLLDEDVAGYFTDSMLTRWLNNGALELAYRLENLEEVSSDDSVASTANYTLPTDLLKIKRVQYNSRPLRWISYPELDKYEKTGSPSTDYDGTPTSFYLWDGELYLYPAPAAALTNGIRITYYKSPAALVGDTDVSDHPLQFHNLLIYWAVERGLRRDGYHTEADRYQQMWTEGINNAMGSLARNQRVTARRVVYCEDE